MTRNLTEAMATTKEGGDRMKNELPDPFDHVCIELSGQLGLARVYRNPGLDFVTLRLESASVETAQCDDTGAAEADVMHAEAEALAVALIQSTPGTDRTVTVMPDVLDPADQLAVGLALIRAAARAKEERP